MLKNSFHYLWNFMLKKNYRVFLLFLGLGFLFKILYFIDSGFWRAELFFYIQGAQKMTDGGILYQDFGEIKPPGIFFLFYSLIKLFGKDHILLSAKILNVLFQGTAAFYLFKTAEKLFNRRKGLLLGVLFLIALNINFRLWITDVMTFSLCPLLISIYFLIRDEWKFQRINLFLSGFFLGIAFMISTNLFFFLILYPFLVFFIQRKWGRTALSFLEAGIGFMFPVAAVFFYFYHYHALGDLYWWNVKWAGIYSGQYSLGRRLWAFLDGFREMWMWIPLYFYLVWSMVSFVREKSWKKQTVFFLISLLLVSLASRLVFSQGSHRYYLYLLPVFILLAGCSLTRPLKFHLKILFGAVVLIGFIYSHYRGILESYDPIMESRKSLIDLIMKNSSKNDQIFVWHEGYEIYYLSGRKMAGSFFSPSQHLVRDSIWKANQCRDISVPWEKFLRELKRERPVLIIDPTYDFLSFSTPDSQLFCESLRSYLKDFRSYVYEHYEMISDLKFPGPQKYYDQTRVWKRKD